MVFVAVVAIVAIVAIVAFGAFGTLGEKGLAPSCYPAAVRVAAGPALPSIPMPGYLQPVFYGPTGTRITRISERRVEDGDARVIKHDYARRAAWNADGSRLLLVQPYPARLLDGRDYTLLGRHQTPSDALWSNLDPDLMFGLQNDRELVEYRVSTRSRRLLHAFGDHERLSLGGAEAMQSDDDRFFVLLGVRDSGLDLIVYDRESDSFEILRFAGMTGPNADIDWAGVSPSGRYLVVKMDRGPGDRGFDVYDRESLARERRLLEGSQSHADFGIDAAGDEVLVASGVKASTLVSARLSDGRIREELPAKAISWNLHVSCRNIRRPGWCYISTWDAPYGHDAWLYRGIFAVSLDGSARLERYAPALFASSPADLAYERQAWAVPSPDGRQVLFGSDWGDPGARAMVHAFVAEVPPTKRRP